MDSVYLGEEGSSTTFSCDRQGTPDLRLLHYNDVYHVESGSAEPIGGTSRFQTIINQYHHAPKYADQPSLLTFFSGDAFNPSLESTVTKGRHMIPFLNNVGTDVACVGNHDLDFGIAQFRHLRNQCKFPWLLANVLDPALGEDVALANCEKTCMLTSSNGIKIGVIGLGEREWLDTVNSLPPIIYKSASETAKRLVPALREQGAELVVAVTHQREPNDNKLAEKLPAGMVDIILGGHDHYYSHSVINSTHILRSGSDFRQLSYLEAWRKEDGSGGWDFSITRRDILRRIPEDPATVALISKVTSTLRSRLEKPIGYTAAPLDARFTTVRTRESNIGNLVCDLMRFYYGTDCAIMAAGTIRGDQIYTPGVLRLKDIMNCFPFEDPVVVLRVTGQAILGALENGVSTLPALEGRFPQVSNICFAFSGSEDPGSRVQWVKIDDEPIELERKYTLATRGYMSRAKDGFASLLVEAEGGEAEEIVSEENGVLISTILRQYFLNLKVMGKWHRWSASLNRHWGAVHEKMQRGGCSKIKTSSLPEISTSTPQRPPNKTQRSWNGSLKFHQYTGYKQQHIDRRANGGSAASQPDDVVDSDSDSEPEILSVASHFVSKPPVSAEVEDREMSIARMVVKKWMRLAGIAEAGTIADVGEEFTPSWTQRVAPRVEGRIQRVDTKTP